MASRSFSPILLRLFALLPALVAAAVPHLTNSLESYYDITPGGEFAIGWQSDSKPCEPTFWLVTGKGFAREREQLIDGRSISDARFRLIAASDTNGNQLNLEPFRKATKLDRRGRCIILDSPIQRKSDKRCELFPSQMVSSVRLLELRRSHLRITDRGLSQLGYCRQPGEPI